MLSWTVHALDQAEFYNGQKVIHNRKHFGYMHVILHKKTVGSGPVNTKCKHDLYFEGKKQQKM